MNKITFEPDPYWTLGEGDHYSPRVWKDEYKLIIGAQTPFIYSRRGMESLVTLEDTNLKEDRFYCESRFHGVPENEIPVDIWSLKPGLYSIQVYTSTYEGNSEVNMFIQKVSNPEEFGVITFSDAEAILSE